MFPLSDPLIHIHFSACVPPSLYIFEGRGHAGDELRLTIVHAMIGLLPFVLLNIAATSAVAWKAWYGLKCQPHVKSSYMHDAGYTEGKYRPSLIPANSIPTLQGLVSGEFLCC